MPLETGRKEHIAEKVIDSSIEDIINGMRDWVRVLDREDNVIYMNQSMAEGLKGRPVGVKCYQSVGRKEPCENCVSRKAVFEGLPSQKEEVIGDRVFSIMSSPVKNIKGETVAAVEVLRDITQLKQMQQQILLQNSKLRNDLVLARKLQCSLLPKQFSNDRIHFSYIYQPCETLGGDFLDIYPIDTDHIGIYVADVSGHGVSASMLTVFLRSSMNKKILSPAHALSELYHQFNTAGFDPEQYITVFYAIVDLKKKCLTYANGGHNVPPVLFGKGSCDFLRMPGVPISNWVDKPGYQEAQIPLRSGSRIFFCTDGIIEMKNAVNEQFGEERLLELVLSGTSEPGEVLNRIMSSAVKFAGTDSLQEISDDITMALLEIK